MTGLDGDATILSVAKWKANRLGLSIDFEQGLSYSTPFESNRFDRCRASHTLAVGWDAAVAWDRTPSLCIVPARILGS